MIELQNHQTKLATAKESASAHFRQCVENVENQLNTYNEYEKSAHARRLVALSNSLEIDPNDNLPFTIV